MTQSNEMIDELVELGWQHYQNKGKPDPFAATAARIVAQTTAEEHCKECSDAAAFVAAANYNSVQIDLSKSFAELTNNAIQMHNAMNQYQAKASLIVGQKMPDIEELELSFDSVVEKMEEDELGDEATALYQDAFDEKTDDKYRLARLAACNIYPHAYSCARAAYRLAVIIAARYPDSAQREEAFKTILISRLSHELTNEPVDPSFLMQILCSDAIKMIGIILLVAGILSLTLGICGLTIAPVGAFLISIGLSAVLTTCIGAGMTTLGSGLFIGRFFTDKQWNAENDASQQAGIAMNAYG